MMNLFNSGTKKKVLRGISWVLLLVLLTTNNKYITDMLMVNAQENISSNEDHSEDHSFEDKIPAEEKLENIEDVENIQNIGDIKNTESTESTYEEVTDPCANHPVHNEECGYEEEIAPCTHSCELCEISEAEEEIKEEDFEEIKDDAAAKGGITPFGIDEGDKWELLDNYSVIIKQGSKEIDDDKDLNYRNPINLAISFTFPVIGDAGRPGSSVDPGNESTFIKGGDVVTIDLPADFNFSIDSAAEILWFEGVNVGSLKIVGDKLEITFNNNIDDNGISNAIASISMDMLYNGDIDDDKDDEVNVEIFEKNFTLSIPAKITTVTAAKSGTADTSTKEIEWKVKITANKEEVGDSEDGYLDGYTFFDDLSNVGDLVPGSFKITTDEAGTIEATGINTSGVNYSGGNIEYTFTSTDSSKIVGTRYVIFKTFIPDEKYYDNGGSVTNRAEIIKDRGEASEEVVSNPAREVTFTMDWINKTGRVMDKPLVDGAYDPNGRQIEWTIVIKGAMTDAVLTDLLPAGLSYDSGEVTRDGGSPIPLTPTEVASADQGGREKLTISLGDITGTTTVVIITNVDDADVNGQKKETYYNSAEIYSAELYDLGNDPIGYGPVGVTVGIDSITKASGGYTDSTHEIGWNITVNTENQSLGADLRVLDLIVYGDASEFKNYTITNIQEAASSGSNSLLTVTNGDLDIIKNQSFGHSYQQINPSTINLGSTGLDYKIYTIFSGTDAVADLLVVTGNGGMDGGNSYDGMNYKTVHNISYNTIVTNPDYYASNATNTIYNTAYLFSGNTPLSNYTNDITITSHMISKDVLARNNATTIKNTADSAGNLSAPGVLNAINNGAGNITNSFDYVDKTVIYRIYVNANNLDIKDDIYVDSNGTIQTGIGNYKIEDALPAGWEFKPISGTDTYFLLYNGTSANNSAQINAAGLISNPESIVNFDMNPLNTVVNFDFPDLDDGYVILLKAGPTDAYADDYFKVTHDINSAPAFTNTAKLVENTKITVNVEDTVDVKIENSAIRKTLDQSNAENKGYLIWTVNYTPYDRTYSNAYIKDTLDPGIDLRTNSAGKLLIKDASNEGGKDNIEIYPLALGTDGNYAISGSKLELTDGVSDTLSDTAPLSYDRVNRALTFTPPNKDQAYRLIYYTDITGTPGTVNNAVEFYSGSITSASSKQNYAITSSSSMASFTRSGYFTINKTDGQSNAALNGMKFILYSTELDGNGNKIAIREGLTGTVGSTSGVLTLRALPVGTYILKEESSQALTDGGYNLSANEWKVEVRNVSGSIKTYIDDVETIQIDIKNHKLNTVGNLLVSKVVLGTGTDSSDFDKQFTFTLNLKDSSDVTLAGKYPYNVLDGTNAVIRGGMIGDNDTFSISSKERFKIMDLPKDSKYKLQENDYSSEGYVHSVTNGTAEGTIDVDATKAVEVTNIKNIQGLIINKLVEGQGGRKDTLSDKEYEFEITLSKSGSSFSYTNLDYTGLNGKADGTLSTGDTITLKADQGILIPDLPEDTEYKVTETDYTAEGYVTVKTNDEGLTGNDKDQSIIVTFRNIKKTGNLIIKKTVAGNEGDTDKLFDFEVDITIPGNIDKLSYDYEIKDKSGNISATGALDFTGSRSITEQYTLSGNETITIYDLPEGTAYDVTEEDYSDEGYSDSVDAGTSSTGTIADSAESKAFFTNTKNVGALSIRKVVDGNEGETSRKFDFRIVFEYERDEYQVKYEEKDYSYTIVNTGENGTIKSGGSISLSHGQTVLFEELEMLDGLKYTVTESDYSSYGYTMKATEAKGNILAGTEAKAVFTNTKQVNQPGSKGGDKEEPVSPRTNKFKITEIPDPNGKDSPPVIEVVDKDGKFIGIFKKIQNPDGSYSYVNENGVLLSEIYKSAIVKTGDSMPLIPILIVTVISAIGLAILILCKKRYFGYYYD